MNIIPRAAASEQTFTQFLFQSRRNRIIQYIAAAGIIIQFALFKYLYPFANYIHDDSFMYLQAAAQNSTVYVYPIGYSKFLRLVSVFAKPDIILISLQYLMIQCSTLYLLFTIFYFYKVGRVTQAVLFCFMIFNPLFLHLGNLVSSDGLFLALSMTWFALLLWIIHKPSVKIICWHAIILFLAFTVRYNALIYPLISALAFWLTKLPPGKKLTGWGLGLLLCGWFIALNLFYYKKLTGYWLYSPFSGWLLANNAMDIYQEVDSADREPVPAKFMALDSMIRQYYDTNQNHFVEEASTAYMWVPEFPLMQYRYSLRSAKDTSTPKFKDWASLGPLYSSYGVYIIKKYPMHFLRYFVWPNSRKYFSPPVEYLGNYNDGKTTVLETASKWFGYENNQVKTRMKTSEVSTLQYYPFLVGICNLIMLLMLLSYLVLKGWKYNPAFYKFILLAGFTWITNAGFTILATSAALRFQAFPALLSTTFAILIIDWMVQLMQHLKLQGQDKAHREAGVI